MPSEGAVLNGSTGLDARVPKPSEVAWWGRSDEEMRNLRTRYTPSPLDLLIRTRMALQSVRMSPSLAKVLAM